MLPLDVQRDARQCTRTRGPAEGAARALHGATRRQARAKGIAEGCWRAWWAGEEKSKTLTRLDRMVPHAQILSPVWRNVNPINKPPDAF